MPPVHKEEIKKPQESVRRGLYVAFASDDAFINLMASGKIHLFISIEKTKQVFEAKSIRGKVTFKSGAPAKGLDLWGVPEDLVPERIVRGFSSWTTLASRPKLFIVGLTSGIARQIRNKNVSSGVFRIGPDGKVTYSENFED